MPMDEESTVRAQFGWLPLSVYRPPQDLEWKELIKDEGDIQTRRSGNAKYLPNLRYSEFHPKLAEVVIRYWSMPNDLIVDPFAGRATRGLVALTLKRRYEGYEVAPTTYQNTLSKISSLGGTLFLDDGCFMKNTPDQTADLVFTCPPYFQQEKYESCEGQLSDQPTYESFLQKIELAVKNIYRVLKDRKFVCWVCADFRESGKFRLFHYDSISLFQKIGFKVHDLVVIHNNSPFAALQAGKVTAKRYTSKIHEYLLVLRK